MKTKPAWKRVGGPMLVFLLGMIFGGCLTGVWVLKRAEQLLSSDTAGIVEEVSRAVGSRLGLSEEQKKAIQPVVRRISERFQEMQTRNAPEIRSIVEEAVTEVNKELTPEQQKKLELLLQQQRQRWKSMIPEPTTQNSEP